MKDLDHALWVGVLLQTDGDEAAHRRARRRALRRREPQPAKARSAALARLHVSDIHALRDKREDARKRRRDPHPGFRRASAHTLAAHGAHPRAIARSRCSSILSSVLFLNLLFSSLDMILIPYFFFLIFTNANLSAYSCSLCLIL